MAAPRRVIQGTDPTLSSDNTKKLGLLLSFGEDQIRAFEKRVELFEILYEKQQKQLLNKPHKKIRISIPSLNRVEYGTSYETTPLQIALLTSQDVSDNAIVARVCYAVPDEKLSSRIITDVEEDLQKPSTFSNEVDTQLWDLDRPLEEDCDLEFITFDSSKGQHVFWHSSAHILGEAIENQFKGYLTIGPPLERGFYYDFYLGEALRVTESMYASIESQARKIVDQDQKFQRLVLTKEEALEMFQSNPFKVELIQSKIPSEGLTTCYRCGSLIDLCRGPHIVSTGKVKAFSIEKHSGVHWLSNTNNDQLQRVYGISFPKKSQMKVYKEMIKQAKHRDHRILGQNLNYFFFDSTYSPGCCFWLQDGTKIYNKIVDFIRVEYKIRNFSEVITPNIFSSDLYKISGHHDNYKENMYSTEIEKKEWFLKPMNCPGHCIMFKHMKPSYKQLPLRLADFGVLHRNEATGSLTGLIRVRRFQQDDAHIFCRIDQVAEEVLKAINFACYIYDVFGFKYEMKLATRPKKSVGGTDLWNEAETALRNALGTSKKTWTLFPGDGAFYGPKIDIHLQDALQRWHQCGTIQIDFQLPLRFDLQYRTSEAATKEESTEIINKETDSLETKLTSGWARPVIIHRAIIGSVERMTAILLEHTAGKLPFWLSPRQIFICPINETFVTYGEKFMKLCKLNDLEVFMDSSSATLNKKIRQAQLEQWNYIAVLGQQEEDCNTVMLRERDNPTHQQLLSIEDAIKLFKRLRQYPLSDSSLFII